MFEFQAGACIADGNNRIVGIGYNGMPTGCDDSLMPWHGDGRDPLNSKHLYGMYSLMVCYLLLNIVAKVVTISNE